MIDWLGNLHSDCRETNDHNFLFGNMDSNTIFKVLFMQTTVWCVQNCEYFLVFERLMFHSFIWQGAKDVFLAKTNATPGLIALIDVPQLLTN